MSRFIWSFEVLAFLEGYCDQGVQQSSRLMDCNDRRSRKYAEHRGQRDTFQRVLDRVRELKAPSPTDSQELNPSGSVADAAQGSQSNGEER